MHKTYLEENNNSINIDYMKIIQLST